ncbi:MAG: protein kinase [Pirellulales bacterium]|nr:protein kinase [Pirellulales bacterium]
MASNSPPGDAKQPLDPVLLRRLHDRLIELRRSDPALAAEVVLEELHPALRQVYRQPLLERLGESQPSSPDQGSVHEEPTVEKTLQQTDEDDTEPCLPVGFKIRSIDPAPGGQADLPPAERPETRQADAPSETQPETPLPESIGKFLVKGELGRGANGIVYLGYDQELKRNVAIKLSLVTDEKYQRRLRVEAAKAAQIESEGIVPVHHIGTTEKGEVYIVQKYVEGTTLREILKNGGPLSPARGVRLVREIAIALEPAHLQDILHRDLKPDNILIDQSGKAWISDFGLAISEAEQQGRRRELAGTPVYMSPEQIKGRIDFLDPRSDIWSVGVMFYEVLTGKLPFGGADRKALAEQICRRDPRPMQQRAPRHLTSEMNDVFRRCCAKKPADRFASVNELVDALDELIERGLSEHNIEGKMVSAHAAHSLFKYDTAYERDTPVSRPLRSTLRTERATHRSTLDRTRTTEQQRSRRMILGAALACTGLIAGAGYLVSRPRFDGSESYPWVVAADGSGSHTTIAQAIEATAAKNAGHVIEVRSVENVESLVIKRKVKIRGAAGQRGCVIAGKDGPAIYINCHEVVELENLTIRDISEEAASISTVSIHLAQTHNTLELHNARLFVKNCNVRSGESNCIKVHPDAELDVADSTFSLSSVQRFAVSALGHQSVVITDCAFTYGGVELKNGGGELTRCSFNLGYGVSARASKLSVKECRFEKCRIGLSVRERSEVDVRAGSRFHQCDRGAIVYADPNVETDDFGVLTFVDTSFENCLNAVHVAGGQLAFDRDCTVKSLPEATGVVVELGTAKLNQPAIVGGSVGIRIEVPEKNDQGEQQFQTGPAKLQLIGGSIVGARAGLTMDHPQGTCEVTKKTSFLGGSDSIVGVAFFQGATQQDGSASLLIEDAVIDQTEVGLKVVQSEAAGRARVRVVRSTFKNNSRCAILAQDAVQVDLVDCELNDGRLEKSDLAIIRDIRTSEDNLE